MCVCVYVYVCVFVFVCVCMSVCVVDGWGGSWVLRSHQMPIGVLASMTAKGEGGFESFMSGGNEYTPSNLLNINNSHSHMM